MPFPAPRFAPLAVSAALLLTAAAASAQTRSFRCKNDLVNLGDSKASVLQKCGEPVVKDTFCKPVENVPPQTTSGGAVVQINTCRDVDQWTYNPGRGQFMTSLQFEAGQLTAIQYGERAK
jgi:hypothetical protein